MKKCLFIFFCMMGLCWSKDFDYSVVGNLISSTRIGFSNPYKVDKTTGIYPNNSFWSLATQLGIQGRFYKNFGFGLKGVVGGVALDSTRIGAKIFPSNSTDNNSDVGEFTKVLMPAWGEIINAYLSYENETFGIKIGRYDFKNTDWFSGHNEGLGFYVNIPTIKFWGLYSYARSSSNAEWLNHFDPRNASLNKFGIFAFGLDGIFQNLFYRPYIYYQPGSYLAGGIKLIYETNFSNDWTSKTTLLTLSTSNAKRGRNLPSSQDWGFDGYFNLSNINIYNPLGYGGRKRGYGGTTLFIRQDFFIKKYNFGGAVYKNFGNPNDLIGSYGDPTGINTWVYTAYDLSTWSDFFGKDAFNAFIFGGGKHDKFSWDILARITFSPRSNEQSLALILSYDLRKNININLRLEYMNDETKKGYLLSDTYLTSDNYTDKSFAFMYITYSL